MNELMLYMLVDYNGFKFKDIIPENYIKNILPEM